MDLFRLKTDFIYWAENCARIKDKSSGKDIPFRLNRPQRIMLSRLEQQRLCGRPIRLIVLKARQWGCSTLLQLYIAWLQTMVLPGRHALVCAHVKDAAAAIRGIYSKFLNFYPRELLPDGVKELKFRPFEHSQNTLVEPHLGSKITIASSEAQSAIRGQDYAFAHLSEVAFWRDTRDATPEGFIRAICGSVNATPDTLVVMESTANGVGNYFHKEWLRAVEGKSDKEPLFIPWYLTEIYQVSLTPDEEAGLLGSLSTYERELLTIHGCTPAQIAWYRRKCSEYPSHNAMMAEYPTTPVEAFTHSGHNVFPLEKIEKLRPACCAPRWVGEVVGRREFGPEAIEELRFVELSTGFLEVWEQPSPASRVPDEYVVGVDVGGRTQESDWSVISVIRRSTLEVVAQWRGHIDHDLLAWKSAAIAAWYNGALLVIESNTLETDNFGGDPGDFILNRLLEVYPNLYYRTDPLTAVTRPGFHTNRNTKLQLVNTLIALIRECGYTERSAAALDELAVFRKTGPRFGALEGFHDDIVMSRALALFAAIDATEQCGE